MKRAGIALGILLTAFCGTRVGAQEKPAAKTVKAMRFGKLWEQGVEGIDHYTVGVCPRF